MIIDCALSRAGEPGDPRGDAPRPDDDDPRRGPAGAGIIILYNDYIIIIMVIVLKINQIIKMINHYSDGCHSFNDDCFKDQSNHHNDDRRRRLAGGLPGPPESLYSRNASPRRVRRLVAIHHACPAADCDSKPTRISRRTFKFTCPLLLPPPPPATNPHTHTGRGRARRRGRRTTCPG